MRPRTGCAGTRFPWSEACTATLSGAVRAGSNPAGGTGQRHQSELLGNLDPSGPQACDLRKRERIRDLAPVRPRQQGPSRERPAQRLTITTATRPLSCPEAVALPPISAANSGSRNRTGDPGGAAVQRRPAAFDATWAASHAPSLSALASLRA